MNGSASSSTLALSDGLRLWVVVKDRLPAEARVRRIGVSVELRVWTAGELRFTRLFPADQIASLHAVATELLEELHERGWAKPSELTERTAGTS